jgi:hypothetical protein
MPWQERELWGRTVLVGMGPLGLETNSLWNLGQLPDISVVLVA